MSETVSCDKVSTIRQSIIIGHVLWPAAHCAPEPTDDELVTAGEAARAEYLADGGDGQAVAGAGKGTGKGGDSGRDRWIVLATS